LKQLHNEVIELFFPRECIGCGKTGGFICSQCVKRLPWLNEPICQTCGKPEFGGECHSECCGKPGNLDGIRSVFAFEGAVKDAVYLLKYHDLRALSGCLGEFMAESYLRNGLSGDTIVPIPLHPRRLRERGYNQSELLAREIARRISLPLDEHLVERTRDSKPQAKAVSAAERRKNMASAFCCEPGSAEGISAVVVDDVCTSGATLEACAAALKAAGAKRVLGFTLAREI
jgi:ComF family protein